MEDTSFESQQDKMSKNSLSSGCMSCGKKKVVVACSMCDESLCKKCDQLLEPESFSFLKEVPENLSHIHYCHICYDEFVSPVMDHYLLTMAQAQNVFVFFTSQRKEVPLLSKEKDFLFVKDCLDRDESMLRLAFFAAELGHNAIIEVQVTSQKIRNGAYQTSRWNATGIAASVDGNRVELQDQQNQKYR